MSLCPFFYAYVSLYSIYMVQKSLLLSKQLLLFPAVFFFIDNQKDRKGTKRF